MRRVVLVALLVLIAPSCGDAGSDGAQPAASATETPTSSRPPDTSLATTSTEPMQDSAPADDDTPDDDGHGENGHGENGHDESDDDQEAAQEEDSGAAVTTNGVVVIIMTEFAFEPASITVSAGETVTFEVVNEGAIPHEFRLSNAHRVEEHLASGHDDHGDDGGHHAEDGDLFIELEAGESGQLTVTFPEDTTIFTEIACLLPGHYEAGMLGVVIYV